MSVRCWTDPSITNEDTKGLPILTKPFTIQKLYQKIQETIS